MAFHRGNAFLTNVTADNLRTDWSDWSPTIDDPYATLVADPLQHARYFNTRNLVITSLHLKVTLSQHALSVHDNCRATTRQSQNTLRHTLPKRCHHRTIHWHTRTKFSTAHIIADGKTQGGADGSTFLFLDTLFVRNLGQFVAGQTYTIRGQIVFEPA